MHSDDAAAELRLADLGSTTALAAAIAPFVAPGFAIYLSGDLGAGKTAFTRALLRALGHAGRVRSPTFTLAEPYNLSKFDLYHFDFYRFNTNDEWRDAGFDEIIGGGAAAVVEWAELAGPGLPAADLWLRLSFDGDASTERRLVRLSAATERGHACLTAVLEAVRAGRLAGVSSPAG
jgi:tRNA threonylcarbamoyladenosine biosynthesis protein TsaE